MPQRRRAVQSLVRMIIAACPVALVGSSQEYRICLVQLVRQENLVTCLEAKIVRRVVPVTLRLVMAVCRAKAVPAARFNRGKALGAVKCARRARSRELRVLLFV